MDDFNKPPCGELVEPLNEDTLILDLEACEDLKLDKPTHDQIILDAVSKDGSIGCERR